MAGVSVSRPSLFSASRRVVVLLTAALATLLLAAACASAEPAKPRAAKPRAPKPAAVTTRTPVKAGSVYLSLGDSVTFGYEEPAVVPTPDYHNAASFLGYPEQLGSELRLKVVNPACPGETSASLINSSAQSNGCENAYRKVYPLHVSYQGSQLNYALGYLRSHPQVRLVSLMIGANDLFLCQESTHDACTNPAELNATLAKVAGNVRQIVSALRNRARYRGQLAIVNYFSLNYASALISGASAALNRTVDTAARPFHVVIADGYGEFNAATRIFGGNTCGAGLLTQLGTPGKCGVHPTYAGQALLAQALEKVIRL
jgi:lysophospholipase L1-like esterase